ncbi:hypothetical protein PsYK624_158740 [Phanerochaete sordida]|uniref:Uncharacterized protein n=1 Tax=Phanerochaete sordida TaxID=48140 RepID=A0A9P3GR39_9APHY|nr:hypothetical protein PsYK624_158740 [Phanerochaete sordida]
MVANTEIAFFRASKLSARPRRAENPARERRCTLPDQPSRASRGELRQTNGWAGLAEKNIHLPSKRGSMTRVSFCCSRDTTYTTHGEGNLRPGICGFPSSEGR